MSISSDIWQSIQAGVLEPFCEAGFPPEQTFIKVFWEGYVGDGHAEWGSYLAALDQLVKRGLLTHSSNGWYNFPIAT